jgi:hypothetical protein
MSSTLAIWIFAFGTIMAASGGIYIVLRIFKMRKALNQLLPRERLRMAIQESTALSRDYDRFETTQEQCSSPTQVPAPNVSDNDSNVTDDRSWFRDISKVRKGHKVMAPTSLQEADVPKRLNRIKKTSKEGQLVG